MVISHDILIELNWCTGTTEHPWVQRASRRAEAAPPDAAPGRRAERRVRPDLCHLKLTPVLQPLAMTGAWQNGAVQGNVSEVGRKAHVRHFKALLCFPWSHALLPLRRPEIMRITVVGLDVEG